MEYGSVLDLHKDVLQNAEDSKKLVHQNNVVSDYELPYDVRVSQKEA